MMSIEKMKMKIKIEYKNWKCITKNIEPGFAGGWLVKQNLWIEKFDSDLNLDLEKNEYRKRKRIGLQIAGLPPVRRDYSSISKASAGDESAFSRSIFLSLEPAKASSVR